MSVQTINMRRRNDDVDKKPFLFSHTRSLPYHTTSHLTHPTCDIDNTTGKNSHTTCDFYDKTIETDGSPTDTYSSTFLSDGLIAREMCHELSDHLRIW